MTSSTTVPSSVRMAMVPPIWVPTRPRTMDRPRLAVSSTEKPGGKPDAVVAHLDPQLAPDPAQFDRDQQGHLVIAVDAGVVGKGVLGRVLQQLGEDDGQRRGHGGLQLAGLAP